MTRAWRRLEPLEIDHGALGLLVGAASLCLLGVALATPGIQLPRCVFKTVTGLPCPTCGLTRTIIALSRGPVDRALFLNPLATLLAAAGLLYLLYAAAVLAFRLPRFRPRLSDPAARRLRIGTLTALAVNWIWLGAPGRGRRPGRRRGYDRRMSTAVPTTPRSTAWLRRELGPLGRLAWPVILAEIGWV